MNAERIGEAAAEREHWLSAAARLHEQSEWHAVEYEPKRELAQPADPKVAALLAHVVESLAEKAATDGAELLDTYTAYRTEANAPRFPTRSATRAAKEVGARREAAERLVLGRWQRTPPSESGLPEWLEAVAQRRADHAPEVIEARAEAAQAHQIANEIVERHSWKRAVLRRRVPGIRRTNVVAARVYTLRKQVAQDRG